MTCFEARKEFPVFWRRAMPAASRSNLTAHLQDCAQCDRAFRAFALSASVLHSDLVVDAKPQAPRPPISLVRPRRFTPGHAVPLERSGTWRPWKIAAAASLMVAVGGFSAWSAARWPTENFADTVAGESVEVDPVIYSSDSATADPFAPESSLSESAATDLSTSDSSSLSGQDSL
jgi:hypothetical protein